MKWIAISGGWRVSSPALQKDVQTSVAEIIERGDGIVSGGALGVDQVATEEALTRNPDASRIKIIIPSPLDVFTRHYRKRAEEGVITPEQAEALIGLLAAIREKGALVEMDYAELNVDSYYARNTEVIEQSDELLSFHVNKSQGTQDTIDKAKGFGMPVEVKEYTIEVS